MAKFKIGDKVRTPMKDQEAGFVARKGVVAGYRDGFDDQVCVTLDDGSIHVTHETNLEPDPGLTLEGIAAHFGASLTTGYFWRLEESGTSIHFGQNQHKRPGLPDKLFCYTYPWMILPEGKFANVLRNPGISIVSLEGNFPTCYDARFKTIRREILETPQYFDTEEELLRHLEQQVARAQLLYDAVEQASKHDKAAKDAFAAQARVDRIKSLVKKYDPTYQEPWGWAKESHTIKAAGLEIEVFTVHTQGLIHLAARPNQQFLRDNYAEIGMLPDTYSFKIDTSKFSPSELVDILKARDAVYRTRSVSDTEDLEAVFKQIVDRGTKLIEELNAAVKKVRDSKEDKLLTVKLVAGNLASSIQGAKVDMFDEKTRRRITTDALEIRIGYDDKGYYCSPYIRHHELKQEFDYGFAINCVGVRATRSVPGTDKLITDIKNASNKAVEYIGNIKTGEELEKAVRDALASMDQVIAAMESYRTYVLLHKACTDAGFREGECSGNPVPGRYIKTVGKFNLVAQKTTATDDKEVSLTWNVAPGADMLVFKDTKFSPFLQSDYYYASFYDKSGRKQKVPMPKLLDTRVSTKDLPGALETMEKAAAEYSAEITKQQSLGNPIGFAPSDAVDRVAQATQAVCKPISLSETVTASIKPFTLVKPSPMQAAVNSCEYMKTQGLQVTKVEFNPATAESGITGKIEFKATRDIEPFAESTPDKNLEDTARYFGFLATGNKGVYKKTDGPRSYFIWYDKTKEQYVLQGIITEDPPGIAFATYYGPKWRLVEDSTFTQACDLRNKLRDIFQ